MPRAKTTGIGLRKAIRMRCGICLLAVALLAGGCVQYPVNAPLTSVDARTGYRFQSAASPTNSPELLLMLAFSGGGTRAAALAFGVLEALASTEVGKPGQKHRLLDEVDLISSVSGGSFAAACYALWGNQIFRDFKSQFLYNRVQNKLLLRRFAPWNIVRLASPTFNTSDLAAEYYNQILFKGTTFSDLISRPASPFLLINATDISLGSRFEFTQDQFDLLQSDLSQFPIGRAVAASSAFPVLLSPIILKNYSAERPSPEPEWIRSALTNPAASSRLRNLALQARSYLEKDKRRFIHLLDGGITDNLGLRASMDRALVSDGSPSPLPGLPMGKARRVAVIIVDAHADRDYGWDSKDRLPQLWNLIGGIERATVSRYSFETIELFRESSARLARETRDTRSKEDARESTPLSFYIVELHFNQLDDESDRSFFNSVPTRLQLPIKTVDRLRQLAARQLASNKEFNQLIQDLGGQSRAQ